MPHPGAFATAATATATSPSSSVSRYYLDLSIPDRSIVRGREYRRRFQGFVMRAREHRETKMPNAASARLDIKRPTAEGAGIRSTSTLITHQQHHHQSQSQFRVQPPIVPIQGPLSCSFSARRPRTLYSVSSGNSYGGRKPNLTPFHAVVRSPSSSLRPAVRSSNARTCPE